MANRDSIRAAMRLARQAGGRAERPRSPVPEWLMEQQREAQEADAPLHGGRFPSAPFKLMGDLAELTGVPSGVRAAHSLSEGRTGDAALEAAPLAAGPAYKITSAAARSLLPLLLGLGVGGVRANKARSAANSTLEGAQNTVAKVAEARDAVTKSPPGSGWAREGVSDLNVLRPELKNAAKPVRKIPESVGPSWGTTGTMAGLGAAAGAAPDLSEGNYEDAALMALMGAGLGAGGERIGAKLYRQPTGEMSNVLAAIKAEQAAARGLGKGELEAADAYKAARAESIKKQKAAQAAAKEKEAQSRQNPQPSPAGKAKGQTAGSPEAGSKGAPSNRPTSAASQSGDAPASVVAPKKSKPPTDEGQGGAASPFKRGGIVGRALSVAKRFATGGAVHAGPIQHAADGGRTDTVPLDVASGSYVVPADIISGLGQGDTTAGYKALTQMFGSQGPKPAGGQSVPILAAGGEFVIAPEAVARVGKGDLKSGHEALDLWVRMQRRKTIQELKKLPGPSRD